MEFCSTCYKAKPRLPLVQLKKWQKKMRTFNKFLKQVNLLVCTGEEIQQSKQKHSDVVACEVPASYWIVNSHYSKNYLHKRDTFDMCLLNIVDVSERFSYFDEFDNKRC